MSDASNPVFYSFRRCPYAMRARLGLRSSGHTVELREVVLRDKPEEMVTASPKATVPVLVLSGGQVVDESIDVMRWALSNDDPEGLRNYPQDILDAMDALVAQNDGPFKAALDRYKYPNRYEDVDREVQRETGAGFIRQLERMLEGNDYLFGARFSFADAAILPFVRQFAHVDRDWFWGEEWPNVIAWLETFLESERFRVIMSKYPQWKSGEPGVMFG